jgi:hypothetical protein
MSEREREAGEGMLPDSDAFVRPPGGPTMSQAGVMPGGPEMEGWKRPLKDEANVEGEQPVEEQAENLRERVKGD